MASSIAHSVKRRRNDNKNDVNKRLEINDSNQFTLLVDDNLEPIELMEQTGEISNPSNPIVSNSLKAPPIVVSINNFKSFCTEILTFLRDVKVSFQMGSRGSCRILTQSSNDHQRVVKYLSDKCHKFYTYDSKTERPFKVVIRGLPNDYTEDEIKNEIFSLLGFLPIQVMRLKKKKSNNIAVNFSANELYLVHFRRSDVNSLKALDKLKTMFHVKVKWENYIRQGQNLQSITQCRNCQGLGHGTKNCHMVAKCLFCGDSSHDKDACPVKENAKNFKCSNCGGNHKSNYWQCPSRKKVLDFRIKQNSVKKGKEKTNFLPANHLLGAKGSQENKIPASTTGTLSYASMVRGNNLSSIPTVSPLGSESVAITAKIGLPTTNSKAFNMMPGSENLFKCDLGEITPEKLNFLQKSLFDLMTAMISCNNMFEAFQTGFKFANDIVMKLKFSNGPF